MRARLGLAASRRRGVALGAFLACVAVDFHGALLPAAAAGAPATLGDSLALEARGDLRGALAASQAVTELTPGRYFPRLRTAYLELALGSYAAAADDYRLAALLAPRSIEALLGEQQALVALAHHREAEAVGRAILARDPSNYLGKARLAWSLYNLGRYAEAASLYASVLTLYPGDLELTTGLGYSELGAGRKSEARVAFRAVLEIAPSHARARAGLASCR